MSKATNKKGFEQDNASKNYKGSGNPHKSKSSRGGKNKPPRSASKDTDKDEQYMDKKGTYASNYIGSENDPSWYNKLRTLVTDVTKLPFNTQAGTGAQYDNPSYSTLPIPGICSLTTLPVIGVARTATDGVNIAATGVFQYIRKNLSTVASYAPADVMMYAVGIMNIYSAYAYILRMFGLANVYSSLNLYYGQEIFKALGMSPADYANFISNLNNYRSQFNNLIYKASTLYLPTDFSVMERWAWLFSNYFVDHDDPKAQIYIHKPAAFYILNETANANGTALVSFSLSDPSEEYPVNMDTLLTLFDAMIEAYRNSDSMNKIAADMKRAFEDRGTWKLAYVPEDYMITPVHSTEVLSQIENTTILPYPKNLSKLSASDWDIIQNVDHNIITFNPSWTGDDMSGINVSPGAWRANKLINMHWNDPSSDDIAVATRDMVFLEEDIDAGTWHMSSCGSDIVVGCQIHTRGGEPMSYVNFESNKMPASAWLAWIACDWAPTLYIGESKEEGAVMQNIAACCEYDNYTFIEGSMVDRMNNNIIMSMWSIPQLGAFEG